MTVVSMTLFGTSVGILLTSVALLEVTSFDSSASGSQKNDNSEVVFLHESTGTEDVMILVEGWIQSKVIC